MSTQTQNGTNPNDPTTEMTSPTRLTGTITRSGATLAIVAAVIGYLAEHGHALSARKVAQDLATLPEADALASATQAVERAVPVDEKGQPVYFGPHPYLPGPRFGLWSRTLKSQMDANAQRAAEQEAKRKEREDKKAKERADIEARAAKRAEERAAKKLERAKLLMQEAESLRTRPVAKAADTTGNEGGLGTPSTGTPGAPATGTQIDSLDDLNQSGEGLADA